MPTSSCNFQQYDVSYEGSATKIKDDTTDHSSPTIYSFSIEDITFALTKTKEQPLRGYTLLRSEHPKLFILETTKGDTFAQRGSIPVNNLDIFAYVNSKFVYDEKHMRNQMTSLYIIMSFNRNVNWKKKYSPIHFLLRPCSLTNLPTV